MLNSKTRELIALQEEAQAKLAETRRSFVDGMKIAKEAQSGPGLCSSQSQVRQLFATSVLHRY
jgi:hypothetical protein